MIRKLKTLILLILGGSNSRVKLYLRLILFLKKSNKLRLAGFVANRLQRKYGVFISPKTTFDKTLEFRHPIGIIVGEGVCIKENVVIYQNVTLGGARIGDGKANNYPKIGANTVIFAGAVIIGNIEIGNNCIIGANSVVTKNIPSNCTAVGAPARIIKKVD